MTTKILALVVGFIIIRTHAGSYDEMVSLHTDLLSNYNTNIRPILDQDDSVDVSFSYTMAYFHEFDAVTGKLAALTSIYLGWFDEKLSWDPANYGNIQTSYFSKTQVWTPSISLSSGIATDLLTPTSSVGASRYGYAFALYSKFLISTCSPDITYYPYDIHNCTLYFTVMEPYNVVDLNINPSTENYDNTDNLFWIVTRTGTGKYYSSNFTATISISYSLERRPTYLLYTIMLPVCLLNFVTLLAFILPAESGERVSFATTMLLTLTMYMTIMSDSIPNTSDPVSIFTISLMVKLIISALMVWSVIITLCVYNRNEDKAIPQWMLYCLKSNSRRVVAGKNEDNMLKSLGKMTVVSWKSIGRRTFVGFKVDLVELHANVMPYSDLVWFEDVSGGGKLEDRQNPTTSGQYKATPRLGFELTTPRWRAFVIITGHPNHLVNPAIPFP
ncbi:acetylcholine receptor subunit beta-like [Argopecten irradians]|uniref:acetylcholine receptor subunit beta-like n=1 Tax=Argopecten irradians TaxID=31199 RepID=UPI003718903D